MNIREYRPEDCEMIANLFYETIHSVNSKDYTEIQLNAWALRIPEHPDGGSGNIRTRNRRHPDTLPAKLIVK